MKPEAEIRAWLAKPRTGRPGYLNPEEMVPYTVAVWLVQVAIRKVVLGEIPDDVHPYYCYRHKQPYLAKEGHNYGCAQCAKHDIWEPEGS